MLITSQIENRKSNRLPFDTLVSRNMPVPSTVQYLNIQIIIYIKPLLEYLIYYYYKVKHLWMEFNLKLVVEKPQMFKLIIPNIHKLLFFLWYLQSLNTNTKGRYAKIRPISEN
jgi:hypothetical protein